MVKETGDASGRGRPRLRRLGRVAGGLVAAASRRQALSLEWRRWLADNLAAGVDPGELREVLTQAGVPAREVALRLREASEGAARARLHARQAERAALALRLADALRAPTVARRETPPAAEFFARYWETNTPVILTDLVPRWPAFGRWGPAYFRERFAEVEVEFEADRAGDRDCDANFAAHRRAGRFADYIDRVLAAGPSNDLYAIAQNHNLRRPELRPLFADLRLPPGYFAEERLPGGAALWFGPAGTVTSLHHDTSNILFCQVLGRKRLRLAAPGDPALLGAARGVYSRIDPEDVGLAGPEDGGPRLFDVELAAGEALFIPVGWWHHVRALDLSVSLALNAFRRPNSFPWYVPGAR
ncbi:MAG: cupin-like domain-containing protein [Nannocystaceae bacterium]